MNKHSRLLLAEDNPINQLVALKILNRLGYHADTVGNGREAVEVAIKSNYDLILMDCQMPELDGYSATEMIRKSEKGTDKHTIIIAMTAHALKGDREKCLASGMDDYLTKPIDMKALNDCLEKWLSKKEAAHQQEKATTMHQSGPAVKLAETKVNPVVSSLEQRGKVMDLDRIRDVFGDNNEAIRQFVDLFIKSTDETLVEIEENMKTKNQEESRKLFHRLKGSAGNSGMMIMHELCISAEHALAKHDWHTLDQIYLSINSQFDQIKEESRKLFS